MSLLKNKFNRDGWYYTSNSKIHFFKKSENQDDIPVSFCKKVNGTDQGIATHPVVKFSKTTGVRHYAKLLEMFLRQDGCKLCLQQTFGVRERPTK